MLSLMRYVLERAFVPARSRLASLTLQLKVRLSLPHLLQSLYVENIKQLVAAAMRGDVSKLASLLQAGVNVDGRDDVRARDQLRVVCTGLIRVCRFLFVSWPWSYRLQSAIGQLCDRQTDPLSMPADRQKKASRDRL